MSVSVKFFANVRQLMGKDELMLELEPSKNYTIRDILQKITEYEHKELSTLLVEVCGKLRGTVRVLVNGNEIHFLEGIETKVHDGDRISIFPLLAGG